jgi:hypothetical protein
MSPRPGSSWPTPAGVWNHVAATPEREQRNEAGDEVDGEDGEHRGGSGHARRGRACPRRSAGSAARAVPGLGQPAPSVTLRTSQTWTPPVVTGSPKALESEASRAPSAGRPCGSTMASTRPCRRLVVNSSTCSGGRERRLVGLGDRRHPLGQARRGGPVLAPSFRGGVGPDEVPGHDGETPSRLRPATPGARVSPTQGAGAARTDPPLVDPVLPTTRRRRTAASGPVGRRRGGVGSTGAGRDPPRLLRRPGQRPGSPRTGRPRASPLRHRSRAAHPSAGTAIRAKRVGSTFSRIGTCSNSTPGAGDAGGSTVDDDLLTE